MMRLDPNLFQLFQIYVQRTVDLGEECPRVIFQRLLEFFTKRHLVVEQDFGENQFHFQNGESHT